MILGSYQYLRAKELSLMLGAPKLNKGNNQERLQASIDELDQLVHEKSSTSFLIPYYQIKLQHNESNRQFSGALDNALRLTDIIQNQNTIGTAAIAGSLMEVARIHCYLGNYDKVIDYSKKGIDLFKKEMLNEAMALEIFFLAYLHSGQLEKARAVVGVALDQRHIKSNKEMQDKWYYFMMCLEFKAGYFDEVINLLKTMRNMPSKHPSWNLGIKFMELITTIEALDYEAIFTARLTNFKYTLRRNNEKTSQRFNVYAKILTTLNKEGFNVTKTIKKHSQELKDLARGENELFWDPFGSELIRLEDWLLQKTGASSRN